MSSINEPSPPPPQVKFLERSGDTRSDAEEKKWGQKEINHLSLLKVYGFVVPAFLIVFATLVLVSISAWSLHYIIPIEWSWLSNEQLSKIQSTLFSGSIGAIIPLLAQKHLLK